MMRPEPASYGRAPLFLMNPRPFKEHELQLGKEPEKEHVGMSTSDDDATTDLASEKRRLEKEDRS